MPDFAFVAGTKLYARLGDDPPREIESPFARKAVESSVKIARKNAWKNRGATARLLGGIRDLDPDDLEGGIRADPVRITGVSRGRTGGELVYAVSTGALSGLFVFGDGEEQRLYHGADHHLDAPACHPDGETLACAIRGRNGVAHLATLRADGSDLVELTDGDTVDGAPAWVPGPGKVLLYESRGIGRDGSGNPMGFAPGVIHRLDLDAGSVDVVVADEKHDCSQPRADASGAVYYVRKPHTTIRPFSVWRGILDVLLFPFRFLWAIFNFFNIFSLRYSGKPLMTAGDKKERQGDLMRSVVAGNLMQAADDNSAEAPEYPATWQLIRRAPNGTTETLASRLRCFDVGSDGTVVYADAQGVKALTPDGKTLSLVSQREVISVVVLENAR